MLKYIRTSYELSQAQVAEKIGVSLPTIKRWEANSTSEPQVSKGARVENRRLAYLRACIPADLLASVESADDHQALLQGEDMFAITISRGRKQRFPEMVPLLGTPIGHLIRGVDPVMWGTHGARYDEMLNHPGAIGVWSTSVPADAVAYLPPRQIVTIRVLPGKVTHTKYAFSDDSEPEGSFEIVMP